MLHMARTHPQNLVSFGGGQKYSIFDNFCDRGH
jgi:hypothetical protein